MRSESEIKGKLKEVKYRYLKKKIKQSRKHIPQNCIYNVEVPSDRISDLVIGTCTHERTDEWIEVFGETANRVCDINFDGQAKCKSCPFFAWKKDKNEIKESFDQELLNLSAAELGLNYPELITLFWVLEDDADVDPLIIKEPELFPEVDKSPESEVSEQEHTPFPEALSNPDLEERLYNLAIIRMPLLFHNFYVDNYFIILICCILTPFMLLIIVVTSTIERMLK